MNKKITATIIALFMITMTAGCATKTTRSQDTQGNPVEVTSQVVGTTTVPPSPGTTTITEESGFFESGNLKNFYANDTHRVDSFERNVALKINAVKENAAARKSINMTDTERLLANVIDSMIIANVPVTVPQQGTAPKTMVDFFDRNFGSIAQLGLNIWGWSNMDRANETRGDYSSGDIVNTGAGDIFFNSNYNKNPISTVGEGALGTFDFRPSNAPIHTDNSVDDSQKTLW